MGFSLFWYCMYDTCPVTINIFHFDFDLPSLCTYHLTYYYTEIKNDISTRMTHNNIRWPFIQTGNI